MGVTDEGMLLDKTVRNAALGGVYDEPVGSAKSKP